MTEKTWVIYHGEVAGNYMMELTQAEVDVARILALYPEVANHIQEETPMKVIRHERGCLHVETPLGIVNIRVGLSDSKGRAVDSIVVVPDAFMDQPKVVLCGRSNTRLVRLKGGRR